MNAERSREDDTAPVTLAPRCPACESGFLVDSGGGIRCMVEVDAGADGLVLEAGCGYRPAGGRHPVA